MDFIMNSQTNLYVVETLLHLLRKLSSFQNKTFIIIETNNSSIITNKTLDLIKSLNINCAFYQIVIKNYVSDHMKCFSYYSTFSLFFFLSILKKSISLCRKWDNTRLVLRSFEKIKKEIFKQMKVLKINTNEETIKSFNNFAGLSQMEDKLRRIFLENKNDTNQNFGYKVVFFSNRQEISNLQQVAQGVSFKFDQDQTNLEQLQMSFVSTSKHMTKDKFLVLTINQIIVLETNYFDLETAIVNFCSDVSNFIEKLSINNIRLLITNSYLTDNIIDSFFSQNIMIFGNVKLKKMRNISKILNIPIILLPNLTNYDFSSKINIFEIKILSDPLNSSKYNFILKKNDTFQPFYLLFVPFISEPKARNIKHSIKTTIDKYKKLLKFKKMVIGGGVFELELAKSLRVNTIKTINFNNSDIFEFLKQEVRNEISEIFEETVATLYKNEGYNYEEIIKNLQLIENKENSNIFYDEYKAKKFCIQNAFFNLKLVMQSAFLNGR